MYAYRTTWHTTEANKQKAIDALIEGISRARQDVPSDAVAIRVYAPELSPVEIVFEEDWESIEAHDAFWAMWNSEPRDHVSAFYSLVDRASSTYRWIVTEWRKE